MKISECNPYLRAAELQPAVLEGQGARMAYDHRNGLFQGLADGLRVLLDLPAMVGSAIIHQFQSDITHILLLYSQLKMGVLLPLTV